MKGLCKFYLRQNVCEPLTSKWTEPTTTTLDRMITRRSVYVCVYVCWYFHYPLRRQWAPEGPGLWVRRGGANRSSSRTVEHSTTLAFHHTQKQSATISVRDLQPTYIHTRNARTHTHTNQPTSQRRVYLTTREYYMHLFYINSPARITLAITWTTARKGRSHVYRTRVYTLGWTRKTHVIVLNTIYNNHIYNLAVSYCQ